MKGNGRPTVKLTERDRELIATLLVEEPEVPPGHIGGYRTAAHAFR